jgi:hypothetical protein
MIAPHSSSANARRGRERLKTIATSHPGPDPIKPLLIKIPLNRGLFSAVNNVRDFFSMGGDRLSRH